MLLATVAGHHLATTGHLVTLSGRLQTATEGTGGGGAGGGCSVNVFVGRVCRIDVLLATASHRVALGSRLEGEGGQQRRV